MGVALPIDETMEIGAEEHAAKIGSLAGALRTTSPSRGSMAVATTRSSRIGGMTRDEEMARAGIQAYAREVRAGTYPAPEHSFGSEP